MKPVLLSKFRPNKSQVARTWGEVNQIIKSTDRRVSWYDCSGHGGYVANPSDFTKEELEKLGDFATGNYDVRVALAKERSTGELYVIGANYEHSTRRSFKYDSWRFEFVEWKTIPMMIFEEDCNWAILTYKLGIDLLEWENRGFTKEERIETARQNVKRWNPTYL